MMRLFSDFLFDGSVQAGDRRIRCVSSNNGSSDPVICPVEDVVSAIEEKRKI
jgi:hypothetical protein